MIPFLPIDEIRKNTLEVMREYEKRRSKKIDFPIDAGDIFSMLFDLQIIFDTDGALNRIDKGIIGCLFPDGHLSPWGRDKIIVVNASPTSSFNPSVYNVNFTIAHEGMGHYVLHFLKGISGEKMDRPIYCRSRDYSPLEWQANFAAGELTQPFDKVKWILDGKEPPEVIDVNLYKGSYKGFFDANQGMMETRLVALGYNLINTVYPWADCLCMKKEREKESEKKRKTVEQIRRLQAGMNNPSADSSDLRSALFQFWSTFGFPDSGGFFRNKSKAKIRF